jgi:hypothetical protein
VAGDGPGVVDTREDGDRAGIIGVSPPLLKGARGIENGMDV